MRKKLVRVYFRTLGKMFRCIGKTRHSNPLIRGAEYLLFALQAALNTIALIVWYLPFRPTAGLIRISRYSFMANMVEE